jgi:hypothetical protein
MPNIIDIDGTLVTSTGQPRARVIAYVRRLHGPKYIVSGRPTSQRSGVEALMRAIDLDVAGIYLNPGGDARAHKRSTAEMLNRREPVHTAVDNDARARSIYRALNIPNVIDPDEI